MPSNYIHWANRTFITAKTEATYGTDPTPAAVDLIEVFDFSLSPNHEIVRRAVNKSNISPSKSFSGKKAMEITFKHPLWAPNATVATEAALPRYSRLLRGCALPQTFVANTDCLFAPSSENPAASTTTPDSLTFYVLDTPGDTTGEGTVYELSGSVGNVKFMVGNNGIPYMEFTFMGFYTAPVQWNSTSHVYAGSEEVIREMVWRAQTITLERDSDDDGIPDASVTLDPTVSFELDMGNKIVPREDCTQASGYAGFLIAGREPKVKFDPERDVPGAYSYDSDRDDSVAYSLQVNFGDTGPRGYFKVNQFTISNVTPADRDGVGIVSIEGEPYGDDDEVAIWLDCS